MDARLVRPGLAPRAASASKRGQLKWVGAEPRGCQPARISAEHVFPANREFFGAEASVPDDRDVVQFHPVSGVFRCSYGVCSTMVMRGGRVSGRIAAGGASVVSAQGLRRLGSPRLRTVLLHPVSGVFRCSHGISPLMVMSGRRSGVRAAAGGASVVSAQGLRRLGSPRLRTVQFHPVSGVFRCSHVVVPFMVMSGVRSSGRIAAGGDHGVPSIMVMRGVRGSGRSAAGGAAVSMTQWHRHGGGPRQRITPPDDLGPRNAGGHRGVTCWVNSASHLSTSLRPARFCQSSRSGRGHRPLAARMPVIASDHAEDWGGTAMLPAFSSNPIPLAGLILLPGSAPHRGTAAGIGGVPGSDPRGLGDQLAGDPAQKDLVVGLAA